jgi:Ribonucleotide reductase, alpha subunit
MPKRILAFVFVAAAFLPASQARADAIDGNWCFTNGRTMSIDGPKIRTPFGKLLNGDYDRHAFSYTIPNGEPDSGLVVVMDLIDDETLHVQKGQDSVAAAAAPIEIWHRCKLPTS